MNNLTIHIGIVGPVSTGKSTFLNAFFGKTYSDMKLKRTTMIPQIYHECESTNQNHDSIDVLKINQESNENPTIDSTIEEIHHIVPPIMNRQEFCLDKFCQLEIYDIPGINDSKTSEIYMEYLKNTLPKLDIVLLMLDIIAVP